MKAKKSFEELLEFQKGFDSGKIQEQERILKLIDKLVPWDYKDRSLNRRLKKEISK